MSGPPRHPFTGFEEPPRTNKELARVMYIEAMHAFETSKWHQRQEDSTEAKAWLEIFVGYRDLCSRYEELVREGNNHPVEKHVAQQCQTPDCRGIFWTTTTAKQRASQAGRPQPSGKCNACQNESP